MGTVTSYTLTEDAMRRLSAVVKAVEGSDTDLSGRAGNRLNVGGRLEWIIQLTGTAAGAGWYAVTAIPPPKADLDKTVDLTGATLAGTPLFTAPTGYALNINEAGGTGHQLSASNPLNRHPAILWRTNDDGTPIYAFAAPRPGQLFAVNVSQTGGSAGSKTTACSFTYDVTDLEGNSLGTGMTPTYQRPPAGAMVAASHGEGYFDKTGTFVLYTTDEQPDAEGC